MTSPTGHLDHRYSDHDAEPVPWDAALARLADAQLAWLVTVGPQAIPHATPLVPVVHEDKVYFRTGAKEAKYANLTINPQVLVLAGDTEWERGLDISFAGTATPVTDLPLLRRLAELWRTRWDGRWDFTIPDDGVVLSPAGNEIVIFEVTPAHVHGFAKGGPFGQTTFRFPFSTIASTPNDQEVQA